MIITTRGKEYYVINELGSTPEIFICREKGSTDTLSYTVLRLPLREVTPDMIKYLMSQVKNESFTEFVDYTTNDGYLIVVMSNPDGEDSQQLVNDGGLSFTERLVAGKKCLEHIFLSDFPDYFVHSALRGGTFKVTEALDVEFEFDLSDFAEYESIGIADTQRALGTTFDNIFRPELKREAFAPMAEFIDKLNSGAYRSLMEIYKEYEAIFKEWKGKDSSDLPDGSKWAKFKAWCKKAIGVLKSLVVYLILLASLLYLIDAIYQLAKPYEQKKVYDKIGDIFIINSEEEEIDGN